MKAAIFIATYNKNDALPNVLYSINIQKPSFPFEVCCIDDHSEVDPEPIFNEFLKDCDFKYKRLPERVGFKYSQTKCFDLMSEDVDTIILQSADVIHGSSDMIQRLCDGLSPDVFTMPEVRNLPVSPDMYINFEEEIKYWSSDQAISDHPIQLPQGILFYTGPRRPNNQWFFFLGAIQRTNLERTDYRRECFDLSLYNKMLWLGYKPNFLLDLVGIHQRHGVIT